MYVLKPVNALRENRVRSSALHSDLGLGTVALESRADVAPPRRPPFSKVQRTISCREFYSEVE